MIVPSYPQLLREQRSFRRLWLGDVASFLGDWFNLIAIYTAVQALSSSAMAISTVVFAKTAPNFLMIPIAGPLVDRFERRRLLIVTDLARAAGVFGLIVSHHLESLAGLYVCTFAMVVFTAIAFPTKKAVLPMLVSRDHIGVANALLGGTWAIMLAFGAALGGVAVQYLGITTSFAIDGATFLVSAAFFAGLPTLYPPSHHTGDRARFVDMLRYLRRTPYVQALTCIKPFQSFANSAIIAVIPLYGTVVFPGQSGPLWIGVLYALRGAGASIGSLGLRLVFGDAPRTLRRLILSGYALLFVGLTLAAHAEAFWVAGVGFFLSALGSGGNWVLSGTLLQLEADESYHGRIFSLEFGVSTLVMAAGAMYVGYVQDSWGVTVSDATLVWSLLALPALAFWISALVYLRRTGARDRAPDIPLQRAPPA